MKNTNNSKSKTFIRTLCIVLAALALLSVSTVAIFAVDSDLFEKTPTAEELNAAYHWKDAPVYYDIAAGEIIEEMVLPIRTDAFINVNVNEDGYYKLTASKDIISGEYKTIVMYGESGMIKYASDYHEDNSVLIMHLEKGVHQFSVGNSSFYDASRFSFSVEDISEFVKSIDLSKATEMTFATEVKLQPGERKLLSLENTKNDFINFLYAEGDGLRVQAFDADLTSYGYDSSLIYEPHMINKFIHMDPERTDTLYALVENNSENEVTLVYKTELEDACGGRVIGENTATKLDSEGINTYGHALLSFTAEETRRYDFCFTSADGAEIELLVRDIVDYSNVAANTGGKAENGTLNVNGVELEAGTTYAVIITVRVEGVCSPVLTIK